MHALSDDRSVTRGISFFQSDRAQKHTILKTSEEGLTWSQTEPVDVGGTPYIHAPITS